MEPAKDDTMEKARRIYEERVRPFAEKDHFGKIVSIDVNSGDYEIAVDDDDHLGAIHRLRARHEDPQPVGMRIGVGPVARIRGFRRTRAVQ